MENNLTKLSANIDKQNSDEVLVSWVFIFRAYVQKLKDLIASIPSRIDSETDSDQNGMKSNAYMYVNNCIKSLDNVRVHYNKIYRIESNIADYFPDANF